MRCQTQTDANRDNRTVMPSANREQSSRQNRKSAREPRANRRNRTAMPDANRCKPMQTATTEPQSQAQTDATRPAGIAMPDALIPASQFRIPNSALPPAVPPRAQTPVPGLKPASTNAAPADNSLAYKSHRRSAASAREMTSRGNARENRIKRAAGAKIGGFLP